MSEPRFHVQEPSSTELNLLSGMSVVLFVITLAISIYAGLWPPVFGWFALHWTTIWQIFVLMLLVGIVGKR